MVRIVYSAKLYVKYTSHLFMDNFITIAKELNMTQDDLRLFTRPQMYFSKYQRQLVYNMTSYQIKLFYNVVTFDHNITTILEKKKALITYLDKNEDFKDVTYIHI